MVMIRYVCRRDSDNKIVSTLESQGAAPSETGITSFDIDAITIIGDAVPSDVHEMGMGTLTGSGPYTYTKNSTITEQAAWEDAIDDWISNGTLTDDTKWKRCVKGNRQQRMEQVDWDALLLAYPQ